MRILGIVLVILGALSGIGAMWIWALHGMSPNVGIASFVTSVLAIFAGGALAAVSE